MGLSQGVVVPPANIQDRAGAKLVREQLRRHLPRVQRLGADGGDAGQWEAWVRAELGWTLEIVAKDPAGRRFAVRPTRGIIERPFAWLGKCRRVSTDYEHLGSSSAAMIHRAMVGLMLRRLAPAP